ncbi:hypothetical protein F4779DRAFT_588278 [Xylariaceae sp. FL0662B]|nr:hypothetical protein F4779DRAFT_588278 [Xylariaceae sp. FL0662B]
MTILSPFYIKSALVRILVVLLLRTQQSRSWPNLSPQGQGLYIANPRPRANRHHHRDHRLQPRIDSRLNLALQENQCRPPSEQARAFETHSSSFSEHHQVAKLPRRLRRLGWQNFSHKGVAKSQACKEPRQIKILVKVRAK